MGLPCPDAEALREAMAEVVAANRLDSARLRITVTGGPAPFGTARADIVPTVIVAAAPLTQWPASTAVVTVPWPRNERAALTGVKTISYGENVVALAYARERGAGEAIFANLVGNLCEGTGSNVFVAIGSRLVTPPLASGCLAGVTRDLLLEILDVEEDDLPISALASAREAFLSSSTREVQPISAVDGQRPSAAGAGRLRPRSRGPLPRSSSAATSTRDRLVTSGQAPHPAATGNDGRRDGPPLSSRRGADVASVVDPAPGVFSW